MVGNIGLAGRIQRVRMFSVTGMEGMLIAAGFGQPNRTGTGMENMWRLTII